MTATAEGVDSVRVSRWFAEHVPAARGPLTYDLIAGGHSNLTYRVSDADGNRWVLRRPPLGHLLPSAHDMGREYRILTALRDTPVPVPRTVGVCTDPEVNGASFFVMEMVDGLVLRDEQTASAALTPAQRHGLGLALADALAAVHALRPAEVGLGDLGRADGYLERQLKRWKRQLDDSRVRPLRELDELHDLLVERRPPQLHSGLVHGDFRLDNCIVGPDSDIRAVLDWELCTQGDTLADVGLLMVYWVEDGDVANPLPGSPVLAPGFPSRAEMLARYAQARGIELPDVEYYVAFGYWRLACITEGVHARYLHGDMGDRVEQAEGFAHMVDDLTAAAQRVAARW